AHHSPGEREQRRALVASQLVGLAWARYLLRLEPLASASPDEVARWIGPTLDRYLRERLPPAEGPADRERDAHGLEGSCRSVEGSGCCLGTRTHGAGPEAGALGI